MSTNTDGIHFTLEYYQEQNTLRATFSLQFKGTVSEIKVTLNAKMAMSDLQQCPETEFKEFQPRLKFKPRLKFWWFHLNLY